MSDREGQRNKEKGNEIELRRDDSETNPALSDAKDYVTKQKQEWAASLKIPYKPRPCGPHNRWLIWGLHSSV